MTLLAETDPRIDATLARLDALYDSSFAWWAEVYDPQTGGVFYALSAKENRDDPRFGPDIEATSKLVNVLEWTGLQGDVSESFKQGVIKYFQSRQDPASGFFRDPQHVDQYRANTLERAAGMARGSLRDFGAEPLYPMPQDRTQDNAEAAAHYAHLESTEAWRAWLEGQPWDTRVWTAGSNVRTQTGLIRDMPEPKRSEMLEVAEEVLRAKQGPDGLFGSTKDDWYSRLSGSYKVVGFLALNDREIPRVQELTATVVDWLNTQDYRNSIVLYNTANILNILQKNGAGLTLDERLDVVNKHIEIFATMKGPDGGFVTWIDQPTPVEIGKEMGLKVVESNTNATGLAHSSRSLLIEFLNGEPKPHPHPKGDELVAKLNR